MTLLVKLKRRPLAKSKRSYSRSSPFILLNTSETVVPMSSANAAATSIASKCDWTMRSQASIARANSHGDKGDPWRTPRWNGNPLKSDLPNRMEHSPA
eukprot:5130671-Amphidinium_carterae.1